MVRLGSQFLIPGDDQLLIAGDSNVHRLRAAAEGVRDCWTDFLPVSGARFTEDRKGFRDQLKDRLQAGVYGGVYILLGSNDTLCDLGKFYREVTEVCDMVHSLAAHVAVTLCSVIPRAEDLRQHSTTKGRLPRILKWIKEANLLMGDVSFHYPYVRLMELDGFLTNQFLCRDGLHLNPAGADFCYQRILEDHLKTQKTTVLQVTDDEYVVRDDEWPSLGSEEMEDVTSIKRLYSDVVKVQSNTTTDVKLVQARKTPLLRLRPYRKKVICVEPRRSRCNLKNLHLDKGKWLKRKFTRESNFRNEDNSAVYVPLTDDNAVWIKASKMTPASLKCSKNKTEISSKPHQCVKAVEKTKKQKLMKWLGCPECKVRCSREDFLLDHLYRKHCASRLTEELDNELGPRSSLCDRIDAVQEDNLCEERPCVFTDSMWSTIFQWMAVGWLCGEQGLQFVVRKLLIKNHGNISRLKLLLSNDVEQNPGPVYACKWENCSAVYASLEGLKIHSFDHVSKEGMCKWSDCSGMLEGTDTNLMDHVLTHINREPAMVIPTIEDWYKCLPDGKLKDDTNLHLCPAHLRCKLMLLLFDEDFKIPTNPYTVADHKALLQRLITFEPTYYNNSKEKFLKKHALDPSSQSNVSFEQPLVQFCYVETSRPEICNPLPSTSVFKKRKHSYLETLSENQIEWSETLNKNLSMCNNAIQIQNFVLSTLLEKNLLQPNKQSFLKIEQECAKLASMKKCTQGTFVCNTFKCVINEKVAYYVRYFESGVYSGFMLQNYLQLLKEQYNASDDDIMLHNVITAEDIDEKSETCGSQIKQEKHGKAKYRQRPDKVISWSLQKVIPPHVDTLNDFGECEEVKLDSFVVHILPYKSKVTVDKSEKIYLHLKNPASNSLQSLLLDYRLNRQEQFKVSSKDILSPPKKSVDSLLQQSILLNCLSGDIFRKPELFTRQARFDSNFLFLTFLTNGTSLRNKMLQLYLQNDTYEMIRFFLSYFPELRESTENLDNNESEFLSVRTLRETNNPPKKCRKLSKNASTPMQSKDLKENPMSLFDNYCLSLVEHGKMVIQSFEDSSNFISIMNDYNDVDGSFKESDFIVTTKHSQEFGDYFECTCKTFHTSLSLNDSNAFDPEAVGLVSSGENFVTCIHCKFLKQRVTPALESGTNNESKLHKFIKEGLIFKDHDIVELYRKKDTRKFSVFPKDEDKPSLVYLTKNKNLGYIASCFNGKCLSVKGHKKMLTTLASATVCKHLAILKEHSDYWQDLILPKEDRNVDTVINESNEEENLVIDDQLEENFDEATGLWKFKCRSTHSPCKRNSASLKRNINARDSWNSSTLERLSDGCLQGPILVSEIPNNTCDCGAGWLKRTDDTNYNANGRTELERYVTIYTQFSPVKCEVHTRLCYNTISPCKVPWDEGSSISVHVLSRDTAAGDEIGWEFVDLVQKSSLTFSGFCQFKTSMYKSRSPNAKFMDSKVFLKWWFSWAANMKIDFRRPCSVCGFEPKRLCCDGTNLGVGFRHAKFDEINSFDADGPIQKTLHRRMDRCFLKNMNGIDKRQMAKNRETLHYLAKKEMDEVTGKDILSDEELNIRITDVENVLPDEIKLSFARFFIMNPSEKEAYARVLKILSTTASVTSLLPRSYCANLQQLIQNSNVDSYFFNETINSMRTYAPELRDLICESMLANNEIIPEDIKLFIQYLINHSLDMETNQPEEAVPQPGTYNPAKYGRAYYFNELGLKLRNIRQFTIDQDSKVKKNIDHDDNALEFERCQKLYSKVNLAAQGTSNLFLWFCADHGHCYGFHMTGAEGRKDPSASLYSHLKNPPQDIFYDFACNLQEYCLNRESGFYKNVRFFHDIFHGFAHKCSCSFQSKRLQGLESVNTEICEQFNSFIQCVKKSARQMSQEHFCFYLQFFLHEWNEKKHILMQKKVRIARAGMED